MFGGCSTNRVTVATRFHSAGQNCNFEEKLFELLPFLLALLFCLLIVDVVSVSGLQTFLITQP